MRDAKEDLVIVDGRPFPEYSKMHIPGGICCPNGELALRIEGIAPDPKTKIVVNCAGRTRSIIGAQTLLDFGITNPVYALENGTQGWTLADLALEQGALRRYPDNIAASDISDLQERARAFALSRKVCYVTPPDANAWLADRSRTTYLFDVRSPEEYETRSVPGFRHAPGGQLIQTLDHWVGVQRARIVLADAEMVRAPVVAGWLYQLGYEPCVLEGGIAAAAACDWSRELRQSEFSDIVPIGATELVRVIDADSVQLVDLRPAMTFRKGHIAQATWSIRPRILAVANDSAETIVLVADEHDLAALAALDLAEAGFRDIRRLTGGIEDWRYAGLPIAMSPSYPADADCIDFLFFVHDRHEGNAEAARQYLAWEMALPEQLDAEERAAFRLVLGL
jgi:rhodanese-related sulfurtransferase